MIRGRLAIENTKVNRKRVRRLMDILRLHLYGKPEIFNSDQGATFTIPDFTKVLLDGEIKISMDGKGRALDTIITERLWRTIKYDEVYLKDYASIVEARESLGQYIKTYNYKRPHSACKGQPPMCFYTSSLGAKTPA